MSGLFIGTAVFAVAAALVAAVLFRLDRQPGDKRLAARENLISEVDRRLPQTQCAQCGYPGCRPYAEAIVDGRTDIDRCPPGGEATVIALATLLGREPVPVVGRGTLPTTTQRAVVDETLCIGCALCLPVCPVDAIVGAPRHVHTVIESQCTGCELCIAPCPVDCIRLVEPIHRLERWRWPRPA